MRLLVCALALFTLCFVVSPGLLRAQEGPAGSREDTGSAEIGERLDEVFSGSSETGEPAEEDATEDETTDEATIDEDAAQEDVTGEDATEEDAADEDVPEENAAEEDVAEEDATEGAPTGTTSTDDAATEEGASTGTTEGEAAAPAPAPSTPPATPGVTDTAATDKPAASDPGEEEAAPEEASPPAEETPEEKGLRLAEEAKARGEGFRWQTARGRMILRDAQGNTNERIFESRVLEDLDDSDEEGVRGIIIFQHPPDIKDTALLTIGQRKADDHQWLYLPALKRVKRISGTSKTGSFVGSEFSFEDLSAAAIEDYEYKWLVDEPCPGAEDLTCHVIERRPKDDESGYSRIVTWEEVDNFRAYKSDFYDRKGTLMKTLTVTRQELFKDRWWRAMDLIMVNHITGKSTQMVWSNYDFDTPLAENDFTVRALERLQ